MGRRQTRGALAGTAFAALVAAIPTPASASIILQSFAVHIDGSVYDSSLGGTLPLAVNVDDFDLLTGLGTLTIRIDGGGNHAVGLFVDSDIDAAENGFYNEFGSTIGTALSGQDWEIDEPGYSGGDVYDNFLAGSLANTNDVPFTFPDDVSMAMIWNLNLGPADSAILRFFLSVTPPGADFALAQVDTDSERTLYFSSTVDPVPVPVPPGVMPLAFLVAALFAFARRRLK